MQDVRREARRRCLRRTAMAALTVAGIAMPAGPAMLVGDDAGTARAQNIFDRFLEPFRQPQRQAAPRRPARAPQDPRVREVQEQLDRLGYDPGPVDGAFGDRTATAIRAYETDNGLAVTGAVSNGLLASLRGATPGEDAAASAAAAPAVPSFDCRAASDRIENMICNDQALTRLDAELAPLYAAIIADPAFAQDRSEEVRQREFLAARDACFPDATCVADLYRERIAVLRANVPAGAAVAGGPTAPGGAVLDLNTLTPIETAGDMPVVLEVELASGDAAPPSEPSTSGDAAAGEEAGGEEAAGGDAVRAHYQDQGLFLRTARQDEQESASPAAYSYAIDGETIAPAGEEFAIARATEKRSALVGVEACGAGCVQPTVPEFALTVRNQGDRPVRLGDLVIHVARSAPDPQPWFGVTSPDAADGAVSIVLQAAGAVSDVTLDFDLQCGPRALDAHPGLSEGHDYLYSLPVADAADLSAAEIASSEEQRWSSPNRALMRDGRRIHASVWPELAELMPNIGGVVREMGEGESRALPENSAQVFEAALQADGCVPFLVGLLSGDYTRPGSEPVAFETLVTAEINPVPAAPGEAGNGATAPDEANLRGEGENYRLVYPLDRPLAPGGSLALNLALIAPETSRHDFKITLNTSAGPVSSPDYSATIFVPWDTVLTEREPGAGSPEAAP